VGEHGKDYLHGRSGIEKTFIDEQGYKCLGFSKFYLRVSGIFFFATYRPERYDCVLYEEFEFNAYKSNFWQLKRVLESRPFGIDIKFRYARSIGDYTLGRKGVQSNYIWFILFPCEQ
jgi:hypothetical protein